MEMTNRAVALDPTIIPTSKYDFIPKDGSLVEKKIDIENGLAKTLGAFAFPNDDKVIIGESYPEGSLDHPLGRTVQIHIEQSSGRVLSVSEAHYEGASMGQPKPFQTPQEESDFVINLLDQFQR